MRALHELSGLPGEVAGQAAADPGSMQGPHGMAIWGDVRAVGRGWGWGWDPGLVLLIIIGREGGKVMEDEWCMGSPTANKRTKLLCSALYVRMYYTYSAVMHAQRH